MHEGPDVPPGAVLDEPTRHWRIAVGLVALGSCGLATVFGVGARDDPYITFWVAEQLAKTGRLVNVNGVHLEQSSSLAHVLVLAALYFVTRAPMPVLGYAVGMCGLFATVCLSATLAGRIRAGAELATAVAVGVAFPLAYWATGELETDLAAASLAWFVLTLHGVLTVDRLSRRRVAAFAASTLLVVTVRPDTMIVALLVSLASLAVSLVGVAADGSLATRLPVIAFRRAGAAAGGVAAAIVLLAGFRELVFHALLPQPELVKSGGPSWFTRGFSYVFTSFPWWMWLVFVALWVLGARWAALHRSVAGYLVGSAFAGGIVVICFSRGDWMGGARLLVPYLALGVVLMVVGGWSLRAWARRGAIGALLAVECVAFVLFANGVPWISSQYAFLVPSASTANAADDGSAYGATWVSSVKDPPPLPWYEAWSFIETRDALFLSVATPVVRALVAKETPGEPITVASNQAGLVFYTWANEFPGKLRFIDTESLATNDFSRCRDLFASYAGELMSIQRWGVDAGRCAPPLPDLFFTPSSSVGLQTHFHVVASMWIFYTRRGITESHVLGSTEVLAQRDGWSP
jgi:hypothetical protein